MIAKHTGMEFNDVGRASGWARLETGKKSAVVAALPAKSGIMPDLRGFGLKDALELLEAQQLQVIAVGNGKVSRQSIPAGTQVFRRQTIYLDLGNKSDR
jgi:cell division protein FtsI (penicillin-binding protein 3)